MNKRQIFPVCQPERSEELFYIVARPFAEFILSEILQSLSLLQNDGANGSG
jgi:hypothetical protein